MLITEAQMELAVHSPYDGRVVGNVAYQDEPTVERWLAHGHALAKKEPLPKWERIRILDEASRALKGGTEEFAILIASEAGKPLKDARVEARRAAESLHLAARILESAHGSEIPLDASPETEGVTGSTVLEPIGMVVAVSAFNHPLNLVAHQVAPVVAAGCPLIVKPSLDTPLCCIRLVELLRQAGLPEPYCRVAIIGNELAERLVTDSRVAFLSFIGSAKVGWKLRSKLAPGTRCALEHGGAAPALVLKDADLSDAAKRLVKGSFYHGGQVCVSTQRIFVEEDCLDEFLHYFTEAAGELVTGDPCLEGTDVGPLIRTSEVDRIQDWVEEAVSSGGKLLFGGNRLGETLYAPTAVLNPSQSCRLSAQEVFGPVVAIYTFKPVEEAVRLANALPWAFQASVFTNNLKSANQVTRGLDASTVMINEHTAFRVDSMPFSGRRSSGLGHGGIEYTFKEMTQEKLIVYRFI